jgi:hypothetical protein
VWERGGRRRKRERTCEGEKNPREKIFSYL